MNKLIIILFLLGVLFAAGCKQTYPVNPPDILSHPPPEITVKEAHEKFIQECVDISKLDYGFIQDEQYIIVCEDSGLADCFCSQWVELTNSKIERNNSYELNISDSYLHAKRHGLSGEERFIKTVLFDKK